MPKAKAKAPLTQLANGPIQGGEVAYFLRKSKREYLEIATRLKEKMEYLSRNLGRAIEQCDTILKSEMPIAFHISSCGVIQSSGYDIDMLCRELAVRADALKYLESSINYDKGEN